MVLVDGTRRSLRPPKLQLISEDVGFLQRLRQLERREIATRARARSRNDPRRTILQWNVLARGSDLIHPFGSNWCVVVTGEPPTETGRFPRQKSPIRYCTSDRPS